MADVMSTSQRSRLMSRIRGKNTAVEIKLRQAVWAAGMHYRLHHRIGRYRPDIVFIGKKVVVFIDGCFWHQCPLHGVMPKGNQDFWKTKLERNIARDIETTEMLIAQGWVVLRIWEHEIDEDPQACVQRITKALASR